MNLKKRKRETVRHLGILFEAGYLQPPHILSLCRGAFFHMTFTTINPQKYLFVGNCQGQYNGKSLFFKINTGLNVGKMWPMVAFSIRPESLHSCKNPMTNSLSRRLSAQRYFHFENDLTLSILYEMILKFTQVPNSIICWWQVLVIFFFSACMRHFRT